jgi:hypothetical protein
MATQAYEIDNYSNIDSTAAIALVLDMAAADCPQGRPFVRDISEIFFRLKKERGIRFKDLGLRKIPGGYYSEDVESFVGQLLTMGYAKQRSPIRLTEKGRKFCETIIEEEDHQDEIATLRDELKHLMRERPASV